MSVTAKQSELAENGRLLFFGLLAYMPFHILLSTWIGTSFGVLTAAKVAKEGILVIGFMATLAASVRQPWFPGLLKSRLTWLIVAYTGIHVLLALVRSTDQDAEILGLVYNTRFLMFFVYGALLARLYDGHSLMRQALRTVFLASLVVFVFGVVQYTLLPDNALARLGYARSNGVLPAFFIDDKPDLERVMSTLRDPNSLGSFVIVISSIALAFFIRDRRPPVRKIMTGLLITGLLCLWFTFSRSAWLGFVVAAAVVAAASSRNKLTSINIRRYLPVAAAALLIISGFMLVFRNTYLVRNVLFHADESTVLESPNELRIRFWQESVGDIARKPLGHGPGTAGLASIRNEKQGTVLNENYYLQIGYELGIAGLALFVALLVAVGYRLLKISGANILALGLVAGLAGLVVTNFLVHIWSNEAVAYTWWGLAGLTVYYSVGTPKRTAPKTSKRP